MYMNTMTGELPLGELTPWPQVMPEEFRTGNNSIKAYRQYYASKLESWSRK